jgi:type VI secretion system secreted protein Hcp
MAVDYFLKLDGIKGESSDDKHRDEIEILSYSWGLANSADAVGGGGSTGKPEFQDFHFTMPINTASVPLFLKCATGEHIKEAILTARKAGGEQQDFYKIRLEDLLVSSYNQGGFDAGDTLPTDQFGLNFSKIEVEYARQKPDGTLDTPIRGAYDLKAAKAF